MHVLFIVNGNMASQLKYSVLDQARLERNWYEGG